ncbi:MAG: hypothetical protein AVDCRST_MAG19-2454, partial [uncultured Thermomicrobiales bacterium]
PPPGRTRNGTASGRFSGRGRASGRTTSAG